MPSARQACAWAVEGGAEARGEGALGAMPTAKYQFAPPPGDAAAPAGSSSQSRNEAMSVYVLPPIWYPDGVLGLDPGWYVKIGGGAKLFQPRQGGFTRRGRPSRVDEVGR